MRGGGEGPRVVICFPEEMRVRLARSLAALLVLGSLLCPVAAQEHEEIERLEAAIASAEAAFEPGELLPPAYATNLPLAMLKLKKARMAAEGAHYYRSGSLEEDLEAGLELLEMAERDEEFFPPLSELTELAYITRNDQTVQPFYVHLPEAYDPSEQWPLIVFLHGYVPSITVLDPWVLSDEVCKIAERNGAILAIPYGRRNTDFQGVGEVDIFRVIEEMHRIFSIDDDRIHLSGVSMGGMGAWNMALRHPGVFAATTPISGQTDMFRWWGWNPLEMTPFKRFLVEWDNPEEMAINARGQQIFVQHGERDNLIPVVESRSMVAKVRSLGLPIHYYEFTGEGHYIYWDTACYQNAWGWSRDRSVERSPERVTFRCFSLQYNRAFWIIVDSLSKWGTPATVDARVVADGTGLVIDTENVAALSIDLTTCPIAEGLEEVAITLNGEQMRLPIEQCLLQIVIEEQASAQWPPRKRHGLCGPAEDVFNTRFVVVQGTAGSEEQNLANARKVATWVDEWDGFADGRPPVVKDSELTEQQIMEANLVLFGTPQSNSVIARIAPHLPVEIGENRYSLLGRSFEGEHLGLVFCYPNPMQPDRYVLIYSGALYGRRLSINHKHDMLPDFLIFDSSRFSLGDTEANVFGGWFDMNWEPNPDTAWEGDIEPGPVEAEG